VAGTVFTAEVIDDGSQEVGTLFVWTAAGSRTDERDGSSRDSDTSSGYADDSSTSVDGDRLGGAISSDQNDSTSTAEEEERRSGLLGASSSATATEVGEPSPVASSEPDRPAVPLAVSDGKCPICLVTFTAEEVATPDICGHTFCVGCLEEWSATSNTCPLDRHEFGVMLVRHYPDGEVLRRIPLPPRTHDIEHDIILPHIIICSFCGQAPGQGRMLFCLGCAHFYHAECLDSVMDTIPNEDRFCPFCVIINLVTTNSS
jgi:PHD and RING finger domain-containing protein 1